MSFFFFLSTCASTCSFSLVFDVVNRTLCESDSTSDEDSALVYVDVFTSSVDNVSFSIILEPVANYTLRYNVDNVHLTCTC